MFSVIFDMDGTLLDTQRIFMPAWDYAGERQGVKDMGKCVCDLLGKNINAGIKYLNEYYPQINAEKFYDDCIKYIADRLVVNFKSGARELLDYLKSHGIKIGLASGSSREIVEHHLSCVNALDYFDAMVCGSEVKNCKPAPDIFLKTAELMGVKPNDCYIFEDSDNGIIAGYKAGMKCYGIADIVPFKNETKAMMLGELRNLAEAIDIFEKI